MASSYFTVPSFARAKKNKEDLEKTNPQEPVLKDEDEKFLNRQITSDEAAKVKEDAPASTVTDDGEEKEASKEGQEHAGESAVMPETQPDVGEEKGVATEAQEGQAGENAAVPETQPEAGDGSQDGEAQESYDDAEKDQAAAAVKARKDKKKKKSFDLPGQEEAEAATRGFSAQTAQQEAEKSENEKRTWTSYLTSVRPSSRKAGDATGDDKQETSSTTEGDSSAQQQQRTWTQYASAYVPSYSSLPSIPTLLRKKDADATAEPVYNEDGTINEEKTREKEANEVSVLLDNLNMSSINNRVFAFSAETQKIYERFALVLKDIINGAPTAYEDMDKLMRDAGPKLEEQFKSMPPFVQTLVKSLPMKLGPEIMAVASEKPGSDMNAKLAAASKQSSGTSPSAPGISAAASAADKKDSDDPATQDKNKKKRRIPGVKGLVSEKGAVAGMLRSCVNFLQTRFPFLASMTNVVMSLAVFSKFHLLTILMLFADSD